VPELIQDDLAVLLRERLDARVPRRLPERFTPPAPRRRSNRTGAWAFAVVAAFVLGVAIATLLRPGLGTTVVTDFSSLLGRQPTAPPATTAPSAPPGATQGPGARPAVPSTAPATTPESTPAPQPSGQTGGTGTGGGTVGGPTNAPAPLPTGGDVITLPLPPLPVPTPTGGIPIPVPSLPLPPLPLPTPSGGGLPPLLGPAPSPTP
jgi:hypothetical protein